MPSVTSPLTHEQPNRFIGRGGQTLRAGLVEHNWDKVGLLAMAIYEQHRRDRIQNYRETFGQAPDDMPARYSSLRSIRSVGSPLTGSLRRRGWRRRLPSAGWSDGILSDTVPTAPIQTAAPSPALAGDNLPASDGRPLRRRVPRQGTRTCPAREKAPDGD